MKKALALSFLLLANIAVLAHSAIPHHYHEGVPVAVSVACSADEEAAHVSGCRHHHHQEPSNATLEDCLLERMYARTAVNDRQPDAVGCNILLLLLCAPCPAFGSVDVQKDLSPVPFVQKPYVQSYHTRFVARTLGLRAPPTC
jgi:hypothetical protein